MMPNLHLGLILILATIGNSCGTENTWVTPNEERISRTGIEEQNRLEADSLEPIDTPEDQKSEKNLDKSLTLISDLDDTVKQTDTTNTIKAIYNGLFSNNSFSGMSLLYRTMVGADFDQPPNDFFLVSGSPVFIENKVRDFLEEHDFPEPTTISLKDSLCDLDTKEYKITEVRGYVSKSENPVILVGDDTERDIEVYSSIAKEFPTKVWSIYIRNIRNSNAPSGPTSNSLIKRFNSAFDIALDLESRNKISLDDVTGIGQEILDSDNEALCPDYADCCAAVASQASQDPAVEDIRLQIEARRNEICQG